MYHKKTKRVTTPFVEVKPSTYTTNIPKSFDIKKSGANYFT